MTQVKISMWSQAAVERHTGLSREVLRKWEQRYGFPQPTRGIRGQRLYSNDDVSRLQLIGRLLQSGLRAGPVVPMRHDQLQSLLDARTDNPALQPAVPASAEVEAAVQTLLDLLSPTRHAGELGGFLQSQVNLYGLASFVAHFMPAFNLAVGNAWFTKRISVAAEHRYTDNLHQVVLRTLPATDRATGRPRVLLTTPPDERHTLALLALHAQLSLRGAECINLGAQTPVDEVVQAAAELQVGVVGISISAFLPEASARHYLMGLRQGLPEACALWVGGQGANGLSGAALVGVDLFTDTSSAVQHWQDLARAQRQDATE